MANNSIVTKTFSWELPLCLWQLFNSLDMNKCYNKLYDVISIKYFVQDFLEILMLEFQENLEKCFLSTTCGVKYVAGWNSTSQKGLIYTVNAKYLYIS